MYYITGITVFIWYHSFTPVHLFIVLEAARREENRDLLQDIWVVQFCHLSKRTLGKLRLKIIYGLVLCNRLCYLSIDNCQYDLHSSLCWCDVLWWAQCCRERPLWLSFGSEHLFLDLWRLWLYPKEWSIRQYEPLLLQESTDLRRSTWKETTSLTDIHIRTLELRSRALAIQISCLSPTEKFSPFSNTCACSFPSRLRI